MTELDKKRDKLLSQMPIPLVRSGAKHGWDAAVEELQHERKDELLKSAREDADYHRWGTEELGKQLKIAVEALEFYANGKYYNPYHMPERMWLKAREALKAIRPPQEVED